MKEMITLWREHGVVDRVSVLADTGADTLLINLRPHHPYVSMAEAEKALDAELKRARHRRAVLQGEVDEMQVGTGGTMLTGGPMENLQQFLQGRDA